jgi:hypothetical protein
MIFDDISDVDKTRLTEIDSTFLKMSKKEKKYHSLK